MNQPPFSPAYSFFLVTPFHLLLFINTKRPKQTWAKAINLSTALHASEIMLMELTLIMSNFLNPHSYAYSHKLVTTSWSWKCFNKKSWKIQYINFLLTELIVGPFTLQNVELYFEVLKSFWAAYPNVKTLPPKLYN